MRHMVEMILLGDLNITRKDLQCTVSQFVHWGSTRLTGDVFIGPSFFVHSCKGIHTFRSTLLFLFLLVVFVYHYTFHMVDPIICFPVPRKILLLMKTLPTLTDLMRYSWEPSPQVNLCFNELTSI